MKQLKLPPGVERLLCGIVKRIRKSPKRHIKTMALALFVAEALLNALVLSLTSKLAILIIVIVVSLRMMVERWLDVAAQIYRVENYPRHIFFLWPITAGLGVSVVWHNSGYIPVLSFLIKTSPLVMVLVSAVIFGVGYLGERFD